MESGSMPSNRISNRDTHPNSAWNIPTGNYYTCLANGQNEETPRGKITGKGQASSPVDMDVNVKKHAENSSDRNTYGPQREKTSLQTKILISEKQVLFERVMFPKYNSFYLTGLFKVL